jgi:hypothetical protein
MSNRNFAIGKRSLVFLVLFFLICSFAFADEGMWLYNSFPKDAVKAKYGFEPTQEWLDHVRLSSVRFNNGASGSFVSSDGLAITNHHVGSQCIHELSTGGRDYMKTGFYAQSIAEEAKCPDLELNQLITIEDVTAQVNAAVKPDMSVADAGQARRAAMSANRKELCHFDRPALRCGHVVCGRSLQPLRVQKVHRCSTGIRTGVRRRLFWRRSR